MSGHGAHECPGVGSSADRCLHLWKVEAHFTKAWTSLVTRSNRRRLCPQPEMASSLVLSAVDAPSSKEMKATFSMAEKRLC